jgi:hypothetical protein
LVGRGDHRRAGAYVPELPANGCGRDARWLGEYAATWVTASVASAVEADVAALRYLDDEVPSSAPAQGLLARLAGLEGHVVRRTLVQRPLAELAIVDGGSIVLGVANTGPDAVDVRLPDASTARLDGFANLWRVLPTATRPDPVDKEVTR